MSTILADGDYAYFASSTPPIAPLQLGPWGAVDINQIFDSGDLAVSPPLNILGVPYQGTILPSYFNDYYNRIWIIPSSNLDFGEVGGFVEVPRFFWNAFLSDTDISGILPEAENVELSGAVVGTTFKPLELKTLTFSTNENGPQSIEGQYSFSFSIGGTKVVTFQGRRSLQWPSEDFKVNWANPYEVEIEYRTDIFVSRNGKEQRRAQRRKPRKRITYQSVFDNAKLRRYNAIIANRQTRTFTLPEETKTIKLSADATAGNNALVFQEVPNWIRPQFNYMLLLDTKREVVRVESILGNTLTLSANLQNDWFEGDYLVPVHTVRTSTSISAPLVTNTVATVTQDWEVVATSEPFEEDLYDYETYEDYYIFDEKHNWGKALEVQKNYTRDEVDFGKGVVRYFTPIDFPNQVRSLTYESDSVERHDRVRRFFQAMRGRAGEFWSPTWERDLELIADVAPGTDRLLCEGTDLATYYEEDKVFRNIYILMKDGTVFYRRIEGYQIIGENTEVELTESISPGLLLNEVELICFLVRTRFASDTFTTSWLTREVWSAKIALQSLEDL